MLQDHKHHIGTVTNSFDSQKGGACFTTSAPHEGDTTEVNGQNYHVTGLPEEKDQRRCSMSLTPNPEDGRMYYISWIEPVKVN